MYHAVFPAHRYILQWFILKNGPFINNILINSSSFQYLLPLIIKNGQGTIKPAQ